MSIATAIQNAQQKVSNAYTAVSNKGGTLPATQDLTNLPTAIGSISTGGTIDTLTVNPSTSQQTITASGGVDGYSPITVNAVTSSIDNNITSGNIKDGVTILGVTGNYTGGGLSGHTLHIETESMLPVSGTIELLTDNPMIPTSEFICLFSAPSDIEADFKGLNSIYLNEVPSDWGSSGYSYATLTMGGVSTNVNGYTKYNLTDDATLSIYFQTCLTGDTLVLMADNSLKRIDEIKVGDKVLSVNCETLELEPDEIIFSDSDKVKIYDKYDVWTFEKGYSVKTVRRHRFYNVERKAMVYMDEWNIGEHTLNEKFEGIKLLSHEVVEEEVRHYKITTSKWHNYFANGMLTGSRLTPKINFGKEK